MVQKQFIDRSRGKDLLDSFSLYNVYSHFLKELELSSLCRKKYGALKILKLTCSKSQPFKKKKNTVFNLCHGRV